MCAWRRKSPGSRGNFKSSMADRLTASCRMVCISANVGNGQMAAISYLDQISLFYWDADHGDLRHAWKKRGSNWSFETLDGEGGEAGRIKGNVGKDVTGLVVHVQSSSTSGYDMLSIFYYDSGNTDLRHAFSF